MVIPDTFGLPEYYISEVVTEIIGHDVRMVCGVKRGSQVYWLYCVVMPADKLLLAARHCQEQAVEAFNFSTLRGDGH